ncbi:hydrophobic protein RCI2B [Carex littledalei]|uniref:Hydrophobic protein RCI2B n=1 Tax=Carex littledalei TaxID=544730 RepID=A0A833QVZ7_9POAL|nr:hydrophobic protein RCI2B [Carex littledalei]
MSDSTATCVDIILAIILPPLGVFFRFGCQEVSAVVLCGREIFMAVKLLVEWLNVICMLVM